MILEPHFSIENNRLYANFTPDEALALTEVERAELAVEKWQICVEKDVKDGATDTCPFCMVYFRISRECTCDGCPIYNKTHIIHCKGTPYDVDLWADEVVYLELLRQELAHISTGGNLPPAPTYCPACNEESAYDTPDTVSWRQVFWSPFPLAGKGWCSYHSRWVEFN